MTSLLVTKTKVIPSPRTTGDTNSEQFARTPPRARASLQEKFLRRPRRALVSHRSSPGGRQARLSSRGELAPDAVSHRVHVRPAEAASAEQHVADQRLDGSLADQPHEEELLDDLTGDGAQRRQP